MHEELINNVKNKIAECIQKANTYYGRNFVVPHVAFDLRGNTAGYACLDENKIRINYDLLLSNSNEMIDDIVPHEVAHFVAFYIYGTNIKPHGNEWRKACQVVGHPKGFYADRTHNLSTIPAKKHKKFVYVCPCGINFEVGSFVHNQIANGQNRFCNSCKGILSLKNNTETLLTGIKL